ncbi:MAG TPA: hypothetical protein VNF04_09995 [Stellaceae bacterium]|nr:hypothetical protein [Stellaceae bacterium]
MRRIAMMLSMAGVIALGLAASPAQADEGWRDNSAWRQHEWREQEWREHHRWHPYHRYGYSPGGYYAPAGIWFGFR